MHVFPSNSVFNKVSVELRKSQQNSIFLKLMQALVVESFNPNWKNTTCKSKWEAMCMEQKTTTSDTDWADHTQMVPGYFNAVSKTI